MLLLTRAFPYPSLQDKVEQTPPQRPGELAGPGFPAPPDRLASHQGKDEPSAPLTQAVIPVILCSGAQHRSLRNPFLALT